MYLIHDNKLINEHVSMFTNLKKLKLHCTFDISMTQLGLQSKGNPLVFIKSQDL